MFLRVISVIVIACSVSCANIGASNIDIENRDEYKRSVKQFIEEMNAKHGFDKEYLRQLFDSVAPTHVAKSITKNDSVSVERANWRTYRDKMINNYRTQQGVLYYNENRDALIRAEREYGVSPHIIIGIMGIETNYGRIRMPYKAIDALATLSFLSTRRGEYFRSELESFLLLTQKTSLEPTTLRGSYAGAIGIPQFMPSNVKRFGVDGDNDGVVDIINSHADAIFSTANYLSQYGWNRDESVYVKVSYKGKRSMIDNYVNDSACSGSKITIATLEKVGFVVPDINVDKDTQVRLFKAYVGNNEYEYHIAFSNLCVLMKYNHSLRYAMAVNYLGVNVANMGNIKINSLNKNKNITQKTIKPSRKTSTANKRSKPNGKEKK